MAKSVKVSENSREYTEASCFLLAVRLAKLQDYLISGTGTKVSVRQNLCYWISKEGQGPFTLADPEDRDPVF